MARPRRKRHFGTIQTQFSKRAGGDLFYPRYRLPGNKTYYRSGTGFQSYDAAASWLAKEERLWESHVEAGTEALWTPPAERHAAATRKRETDALTVKEVCEKWLTSGHLKESSVSSSRNKLTYRVYNTSLAEETVGNVTPERIRQWWDEVKREHPDTGNSNAMAYKRLRTAFQYATEDLHLFDSNPVNVKGAATVPRSAKRDTPLLTVDEVWTIIDGVTKPNRAPVAVLCWSGLRLGELLALRRKDFSGLDSDGPITVRVRRNAEKIEEPKTDADGKPVMSKRTGRQAISVRMQEFDTPKTADANRDVVLPQSVSDIVREHEKEFMGKGADALFTATRDGEIRLDTSFRHAFNRGRDAAGRKDVSPHDCRRFYGTMLVDNNVPLDASRRLMGHATTKQLMEYQRSVSGYETQAAVVLDAVATRGKRVTSPAAE